ncbi:MAG: carbohydrate kinase family protein [Acidobacteria bacterium]|nr:MAG: carbohydrate kinase family protein [Acidobacteriota bacterium]REJ99312.1 MAG: carbohydrate kinase family protein [Acidobacteriota bacterium]REK15968.1 MAG: carbohydrate kinase family protein [Acidobacteriota bacterium]REK43649.1 MAG: carbohydrate kinase family protein [Acidobacteriota bacterium]
MNFPFEIARDREFDVVGFGTNAVDFLIRVPHYPEFDSKVELNDYIRAAGGEVATAMVGLQRLGLRTAYAGRFGKEPTGDFGLESLTSEGVDVSFSEQIKGAVTQIAFIIIDERNGERTVIWKRDRKLKFKKNEAPIDAVRMSSVLHLTPHDTKACIRMAKEATKAGTIVSIDIDKKFKRMDDLLPNVDLMICSEQFASLVFGECPPEKGLQKLQEEYGCPVVGMTQGEKGSLLLCEDTFYRSRAYVVPGGCKDTTGAGDSFRAGLLYGLLKGLSIKETCHRANAVAALKCRAVGARTSLPSEEELENLITAGERL